MLIIDKLIILFLTLWVMKLQLWQWGFRNKLLELEVEVLRQRFEILAIKEQDYADAEVSPL